MSSKSRGYTYGYSGYTYNPPGRDPKVEPWPDDVWTDRGVEIRVAATQHRLTGDYFLTRTWRTSGNAISSENRDIATLDVIDWTHGATLDSLGTIPPKVRVVVIPGTGRGPAPWADWTRPTDDPFVSASAWEHGAAARAAEKIRQAMMGAERSVRAPDGTTRAETYDLYGRRIEPLPKPEPMPKPTPAAQMPRPELPNADLPFEEYTRAALATLMGMGPREVVEAVDRARAAEAAATRQQVDSAAEVERLRADVERLSKIAREAAGQNGTISRLRAEVTTLTRDRDMWQRRAIYAEQHPSQAASSNVDEPLLKRLIKFAHPDMHATASARTQTEALELTKVLNGLREKLST